MLSAGSITVNPTTGAHTGSGISFVALDAWWTAIGGDAKYTAASMRAEVKNGLKPLIQAIADAVVDALHTDAVVSVDVPTSAAGLQTLPTSLVAGVPTAGPSSGKVLAGTIL